MRDVKRKEVWYVFFFFQAEDGIRDLTVTGVQTCALPISQGLFEFKNRSTGLASTAGKYAAAFALGAAAFRERDSVFARRLPRRAAGGAETRRADPRARPNTPAQLRSRKYNPPLRHNKHSLKPTH